MSEFSTEFLFDLQRFAVRSFNGGTMDDETGAVLSDLFTGEGTAATINTKQASLYGGDNNFFWSKSAEVSLTPAPANVDETIAGAISLVSGKFDTIAIGESGETGYIISAVNAVDARALTGTAKFNAIGNTTILNPAGTIAVGNTTLTFAGTGEKTDDTVYGGWDVGTKVSVRSGAIVNVTATDGEQITTADGTVADLTGSKNVATFSNKSFNTITTFTTTGSASLAVNAGDSLSLDVNVANTNVSSTKAAITTSFNGQALTSVSVGGTASSIKADISYGGTKNVGNDVEIQGSAVNVSQINGASSTILYQIGTENGNVLDVFNVTTKSGSTKPVTVSKTGSANFLRAQDFDETGETISIAGVTYKFADDAANGAIFEITNGKVTGFVFRDDGDSITIPKGTNLANFKLYKAAGSSSSDEAVDNAEGDPLFVDLEALNFKISNTGTSSDFVITKNEEQGGYTIDVYDGAALEISNDETGTSVGMEFTLPKYNSQATSARITVDENGQVQSITAETVDGDSTALDVTGAAVKITGATSGEGVAADFNVNGTSAVVDSGEFNYEVEGTKGTIGTRTIQLTQSEDTLQSASSGAKIYPYAGTSGTLVYGTNAYEYKFNNASGDAFFTVNATTNNLDFVFVEKGDAITIPEDAADSTGLQFINKNDENYDPYAITGQALSVNPVITGSDPYTVEMTTATSRRSGAAEFTVKDLAADAVVTFGENSTFTYSAAGGTFVFGQTGDATAMAHGITAASGTITISDAAAASLAQVNENTGKAVFTIDGTPVYIQAQTFVEREPNLVYNHDENSLYGLIGGSTIHDAGSITKIYAPLTADQEFTFGNPDSDNEDDYQLFTARGSDGDIDDPTGRAYFTVSGTKATGFTFVEVDDSLTATDFSDLTLIDYPTGNSFTAPVVTNSDGELDESTIIKALEDYDGTGEKDCYAFLADTMQGSTATFEDGTAVTFQQAEAGQLLFSTAGKMLSIIGLYNADDEVIVESATGSVFIDQREIEITGGGFTYRMLDPNTASIIDVKADSTVVKATGVNEIRTIAGTSGIGDFTFGASAVAETFSVAGDGNDGVIFKLSGDELAVTGISGVNNNESVTGALNGLILNGGASVLVSGGKDDQFTFSGTSFAGLTDGDKVTDAGNMVDFITASEGAFEILGASMAIASDSSVVFNVEEDSLVAINDLAGTATGDFSGDLGVNTESIQVIGDSSVAVTGNNEVVTAISKIGGGSVSLTKIGSASVVETDADGVFEFVEGAQVFGTSSSDGVTFGIEEKKVVSIDGINQEGERVTGNFEDGIEVDGKLVQVENSDPITYVTGSHSGMSGTGIYGLKDGAKVVSASGINVAVAVGQSGTYTFGSQSFTIANDSNNHVGFLLENGKVTGIFDVDGEVSGNLNGIVINQKDPEIRVVGTDGENTNLTYSDGLLTGIKDGDTVQAADNVSTVRAVESGTFTFGTQSYTVSDDADGIDFIVTPGTTNVVGVDDLEDGAALTGAIGGLSTVNGQSFAIVDADNDFGIIGATSGVKEIFNVSGSAAIINAGGASKVSTDKAGAFTFGSLGGKTFTTELDDEVEFALDAKGQATGIQGLSGSVTSDGSNFADGFTVNGQSFAIAGDEGDLAVIGASDEQGIAVVANVGGASVSVNAVGGASAIITDKAGKFTFTKSGQTFATTDETLSFGLDSDEKVTDIDFLDGDITGNFTEVDRINTREVRVTDADNILTITGLGASSIAKISDVDAGATITNVGGASQVITKTAGSFSFAGHANPFVTEGDDELTFEMVAGEDAKVRGITGIDDGAVTGNLSDIESINGQSFAITGDDDELLTYEKNGSAATVSGVAGDTVQISALAGASTVEISKDGKYTFGGKEYDIATGGSATIGVNGLTITSIAGLDADGESVEGDFTSNISVGGKNFNVTGDSAITVVQEAGELIIRGLMSGAKIVAADSVSKAITEEEGTFSDTADKTITIGNGDASIGLDGKAHIISISGVTDGVGGDISDLPINGSSALVRVISAPDGQPSTNLSYDGNVLGGVVANDTVISAGEASSVVANGADGAYQFGTGSAAKRFSIEGDTNGVLEFAVGGNNSTVVSAVGDIDEGATLTGEINGIAVNGTNVSVTGDLDNILGVVGSSDGGIASLVNVGGGSTGVTVMSAGGADEVITATEGRFTFNQTGQKFTVAGDSSVIFGINDEESVLSVDDLDGTVASDFSNPITVNGSDILIVGDRDGNSVVGADGTVTSIDDVNAGAVISRTGNAKQVNTKGAGVFTFYGNDGKFDEKSFTIENDDAVSFNLDENGDVAGVSNFTSGNIIFDADASPTLEINPTVNDPVMLAGATSAPVTVSVDSEGRIIGVAGASAIAGLENTTIQATGPMTVNGKDIDIVDADNSFNVEVKDFEVDKVTAVTGNASINVADGDIVANKDGVFTVGDYHNSLGSEYTIVDEDNNFGMTTDPTKALSGLTSLEGSVVIEDGVDALTVNGNSVTVSNGNTPVTVSTDGTNITAVDGLVDGAIIEGALDNASIAMASVAADDANNLSVLAVNDTIFALMGEDSASEHAGGYNADTDGITLNGKGEVIGLDDGARMFVTEAGNYTVNGSVMEAVAGDTIIGAGEEGAFLYDPDNILVRKSTPLSAIESLAGVPTQVDATWGSYADPLTKASLDTNLADSSIDKDLALEIYTTNPDEKVSQNIDLSDYKFSKKVHLFNGDQNIALNDVGGNLVHVEETYYDEVYRAANDGKDPNTSGKKNIVLGNGGDVVVVDQAHDIGNEVNIMGGTGDDMIFVRNNATTTVNMSLGGADKVVTFAKANARIALEGYDATTGAGVQFDQLSLRDSVGGIANAVEKGVIDFGDGVVSLNTSAGSTQVSLNSSTGGTASVGGSVVNLFSPEGTRQQVAFTHSAGGVASVDANSTEDIIFIGNKNGNKEGGSVLRGGLGNDVAFAGEGDVIDMGDGLNTINLEDRAGREGAYINISAGSTRIYGANNTLDEIHGDTLGVDLTAMDLEYVDGNLIIKSKNTAESVVLATVVGADQDGTLSYDTANTLGESADLAAGADDADTTTAESTEDTVTVAAAASLTPDHNYTNQLINSNGTLIKAAIGATGSVIDAKLDEDVRANYYIGDNSGLTFYGYNGNVFIDLEGDWLTAGSSVDGAVTAIEGINSIAAGTGLNYVKGSDENETFFAGRGNSHLYGDGGRNLLVGYTGSDKEGQTTFYVLGNAYDAANTIQAFDFVDDDNYTNNNRITADKLEVDLPTNYVNRVEVSNNDVVINVTNRNGITTESVIITGAIDSVSGYGQDILIAGDGVVEDVVAQVGTDKLNFDKFANYYNATGKNATVSVANDKDFAQVWLDGSKGVNFQGDIHVIDGSEFIGSAELAGNDYNNTVIAGTGATSLWGGHKGDDALVAGSGQDTFFYTVGNGTDTIYGAKDGDIVNLAGVNLSDIVSAEFSNSGDPIQGVALNFRDGGKLYIGDNGGNAVGYVVNGETYFVNEEHNGFFKKA